MKEKRNARRVAKDGWKVRFFSLSIFSFSLREGRRENLGNVGMGSVEKAEALEVDLLPGANGDTGASSGGRMDGEGGGKED